MVIIKLQPLREFIEAYPDARASPGWRASVTRCLLGSSLWLGSCATSEQ